MSQRKINTGVVLKQFEGKPFKESEKSDKDLTLSYVLIACMRNAQYMGLTDSEMNTAYVLGVLFGQNLNKVVQLTTEQHDTLKKITDYGKYKKPTGEESYLWELEVRIQVKKLVDDADIIKDKE